ncbi:MAG: hypothetical protein ACM3ZT_07485 [Bacillota bacterium]
MKTALLAGFLSLGLFAGTAWAAPSVLTADIPASGMQRFVFEAGDGEVRITPSSDEAVHVQVELQQSEKSLFGLYHWLSDDTARDMHAVVLKQARQGTDLKLTLAYPNDATHDDIKEKWILLLPARLAVDANMQAGQLVIKGIAGGVVASLKGGDLEIHVPKGPVHANLSGGRLSVVSDDLKPGNVKVASDFGLAIMDLNGRYYGPPERHGFLSSLHFWGNTVEQPAAGGDEIQLKVFGGLAVLRVGPVGDVKDYRKAFEEP